MKLIEWKESESKWKLYVDSDGVPITGYYGGYRPFMNRGGEENVKAIVGKYPVLEGDLYFKDVSKGRSSVIFNFKDDNDIEWHMTTSGAADLLKNICQDNIDTSAKSGDGLQEYVFSGLWTVVKQGTQVSIKALGE